MSRTIRGHKFARRTRLTERVIADKRTHRERSRGDSERAAIARSLGPEAHAGPEPADHYDPLESDVWDDFEDDTYPDGD